MRIWILVAVAATALIAGYLLGGDGARGSRDDRREPPPDVTPPAPVPSVAGRPPYLREALGAARRSPGSPATQKELAAFVQGCVGRGPRAVPELRAALLSGDDVDTGRSWHFQDGELREYPSFRAACIEALSRIGGADSTAALEELVRATRSVGEAYVAALALDARDRRGWEAALLDLLSGETPGAAAPLERPALELAARSDPGRIVQQVVARAPRDEERRDPGALARVLTVVSWQQARDAALRLLPDPGVTERAKRRYMEAILRRGEAEAVRLVATELKRGGYSSRLKEQVLDAAVESPAFAEDARLHARALADNDRAAALRIRQRVESRVAEATLLVEIACGGAESAEARAAHARLRDQAARLRAE